MSMQRRKGFTLIEILLVVVIIGIMLAVIVPRAWRANTDAKYNILRQHASEIASYGVTWVEDQLRSQDDDSTASLADYIYYLGGDGGGFNSSIMVAEWIAGTNASQANFSTADADQTGRNVAGSADEPPSGPAAALVPKEKVIRNPFSGQRLVETEGGNPGATAIAAAPDGQGGTLDYVYATVCFQPVDLGTGTVAYTGGADGADFYGAGVLDEQTMRSGVFMARYKDFSDEEEQPNNP